MTTANIDHLIQRTGRSLLWSQVAVLLLRVVWVVVVAVFIVVVLDAAFGFNPYGLLILDLTVIALASVMIWPVLRRIHRGRMHEQRVALTIEERLDIADNALINAVDLSAQNDAGTSVALREAAIKRGEQIAERVEPKDAVDKTPLIQAYQVVGFVLLASFVFYVSMPTIFNAVLPRLFSPFADLPPYTSLQFDVRVEPEPVYVGKPAKVELSLTGPNLPGQAHLVFVDDGQKSPGLPMYHKTSSSQDATTAPPPQSASLEYTIRIDQVGQDRRFYIDTPRGRSKLYTLTTNRSPLIESARVTLRYPTYTGWPDETRPLTGRAIRGLAGTRVDIHVTSNVPLSGGDLRLTDTADTDPSNVQIEMVVPNAVDKQVAGVGFTLEETGGFELSLTGLDGAPGAEKLVGEVRVLPDRLPKVDVVNPDRQVVVPEGWPVDVAIGVGDDIGISDAQVHVGVNNQPTKADVLSLTYTDANHTTGFADHAIQPRSLGAAAGDLVKYYAAVRDNHPDSPQTAETPVHFVHMITMQQYMDLARSQYRVEDLQHEFEAIQELLAELAAQREEILKAIEDIEAMADQDGALTKQQQEAIEALQRALEDYAQQSEALAESLAERAGQSSLYEFEEPYKAMLQKLSEQLGEQADQSESLTQAMEAMGSTNTPAARQAAAQAAERFAMTDEPFGQASAQQTQMAQEDIEKLALAEAMIRQGERIRRVALEQADLAVRLSGLAEFQTLTAEQQQRADTLAQEQSALREELVDAAGALSVAAVKAGDALPNMSTGAMAVVDQIEGLGIPSTQRAAEKAARAGRGGLAHQAALKAAEDLDSLLSDTGPAMAGSGDLDGCFNLPRQQMRSALNQMMAGMGAGIPTMGSQGGQGAGMSGSMARMTMMGPNVPGAPGASEADGSRGDRRQAGGGRSTSGYETEETGAQPEYIQTKSATRVGEAVTVQPGVPVQYREQAEAYFKRIAEESR